MDRRAQAIAELQAKSVPLSTGEHDVAELKRYIVSRGVRQYQFSRFGQCERKMKHPTRDAAVKVARRMGKLEIEPYRCTYCHQWHNGKAPRRLA